MTTTPLDGPFLAGRQLTDYSDDPGYATTTDPEGTAPSLATQLRKEAMGR